VIPAGWAVILLLVGYGIGTLVRAIVAVGERDAAWDKGYARGWDDGHEKGLDQGTADTITALERLVGRPDSGDARRSP